MIFKVLLAFLAITILGRQIVELFSAELGRKDDLLRRLHKNPNAFHFAVLIPLTSSQEASALGALLRALLNQDYPREQSDIYVLTSAETHEQVMALEQATRDRVHWLIPSSNTDVASKAVLTAWGVQRIISGGGQNRLFAFLDPSDIVREDYLSQISQKGAHASVMQGYQALKRTPDTVPSRLRALSSRVFNRIRQAGRAHLGLSPVLQSSGWVAQQDVLEKVPMHRFLTAFPQEYGLMLARCGYPIHWTPSVVVYQDDHEGWFAMLRDTMAALGGRVSLLFAQFIPTLRFMVFRPKQLLLAGDQLLELLRLSQALIGSTLLACWLLASQDILPESAFWGYFFLSFVFLNVAMVLFTRASLNDMVFYTLFTPFATVFTGFMMPLVALMDTIKGVFTTDSHAFETARFVSNPAGHSFNSSKGQPSTETVLSLQAVQEALSQHSAGERFSPAASRPQDALDQLDRDIHGPAAAVKVPLIGELPAHLAQAQTVLLAHEKTTIECRVAVELAGPAILEGEQRYRLNLSHKGSAFQTKPSDNLETAFDDLRARLNGRGFEILSCGSCAYYHDRPENPSEETFLAGVCLEGQSGCSLTEIQDVVTVLSPRCSNYTDRAQHQSVLRAWQASLAPEVADDTTADVLPEAYARLPL